MAASDRVIPKPWHPEQLQNVGKRAILDFLVKEGSPSFLKFYGLDQPFSKNALAKLKITTLSTAYNQLYLWNDADSQTPAATALKAEEAQPSEAEKQAVLASASTAEQEYPKFTLQTLTKGDKTNFPKARDKVSIKYKGSLAATGKVFDSNQGKKDRPLTVVIGSGKMIRGLDEALRQMSVGETAQINIESDWAYGAKGLADIIPPNSDLIFEVTLITIH